MDQAQANASIRFIVTFGHRPAYSSGYHPGEASIRSILDTLGVRHSKYVLNLNGHSHDYERSTPRFGVTHVTVGIGGSTLERVGGACPWGGGCPAPAWCAYRAFHHGALRLAFDATSISGTVLCGPAATEDDIACAQGAVFDAFTITGQGVTSAPPLPPPGLALNQVRPDPAEVDERLTFSFSLLDGAPARIEMLDLSGRAVHRIDVGSAGAGRHEAQLSTPHGLPPGIYWLRLKQSGREVRRSVVLLP